MGSNCGVPCRGGDLTAPSGSAAGLPPSGKPREAALAACGHIPSTTSCPPHLHRKLRVHGVHPRAHHVEAVLLALLQQITHEL